MFQNLSKNIFFIPRISVSLFFMNIDKVKLQSELAQEVKNEKDRKKVC